MLYQATYVSESGADESCNVVPDTVKTYLNESGNFTDQFKNNLQLHDNVCEALTTTTKILPITVMNTISTAPVAKMIAPPRYRFRDLILGDFSFNDDGER